MRVIAAWGNQPISKVISATTSSLLGTPKWSPSHVALIVRTSPEVELSLGETSLWVESSTLIPRHCILQNRQVVGLQAHKIKDRLEDYPLGNVVSYRLRRPYALSDLEEEYLSTYVFDDVLRTPYDIPKPGWWTNIIKTALFKDTNILLCSEFVQDVLIHLGRASNKNPSNASPGSFLRRHLRDGILVEEGPLTYAACRQF